MHAYYEVNKHKIQKMVKSYMKPIEKELSNITNESFDEVFLKIWAYYEENLLAYFPYIGGNQVSGTKNLTGAYGFVAMGEVLKTYGVEMEDIGHLMVLAYERKMNAIPGFLKPIIRKVFAHTSLVNNVLTKKDAKNAANAKVNPGSFETKTQMPPEEGYDISYHNLVCPLAVFARTHGYEEYMPYLCNLDYVMFGSLGLSLLREHTIFMDGDYCDFKTKLGAPILPAWPPVYQQKNKYK